MGRRKQVRPHRSIATRESQDVHEGGLNDQNASEKGEVQDIDSDKSFFVEVDRTNWVSDEHFDISEILLTNLNITPKYYGYELGEDFYTNPDYSLTFRLSNVNGFLDRIKLGHWPVFFATSIYLEFIEKHTVEEMKTDEIMLSGSFDGPDEGVSGLVHLAKLKFLTLRPLVGEKFIGGMSSLRVRVEILRSLFDACDSLHDDTRQQWKKSMLNLMAWLRPEVMTSEARYGHSTSTNDDSSYVKKLARFDASGFYEAVKPSKEEPMLDYHMPDLLPELRPYQRRAAYWMVQREKGTSGRVGGSGSSQLVSPLCLPVDLIDSCSRMFYNPFSGNVSLHPDYSCPFVYGGILADEMGLGKTVELLACIFAHRKPASEDCNTYDNVIQDTFGQKNSLKRLKRERVECICGAVSESIRYKGLWVQCDICDAWQHADCVGYSAKGKTSKQSKVLEGKGGGRNVTEMSGMRRRKKNSDEIFVMDGAYICQLCSELVQITDSPIATGATLIVCPAPILAQWHSEIIRHTNPGSLKIHVYEGVRNASLSNTSTTDIGELLSADIVLTTYDVLKEDLSHDSDRHEGDRRLMRFQKRYPVIPTLLTRIFWWRICLDEAQMVESNAAAATEMALRLHARNHWCITGTPIQRKLDDLYGLLKFLRVSPFDSFRWWNDVIRDPYEKGDTGAMVFAHNFFKQIMWRSSKLHVADELHLPPQEESVSWLFLSPIEEHFYRRQHETCVSYARKVIESFRTEIFRREGSGSNSSDFQSDPFITHVEAAKLLNSLLKLRQACCHPQVGSSGLRSLQQSPMTMDEILLVLIGKTKAEGEEALRKSVVALNGLAGIAIIKKDFLQAVSLYEEALALAAEHSEDFRLDPLLNIHIHHNLTEIIPLTSDGQFQQISHDKVSKMYDVEESGEGDVKRRRISREDSSDRTVDSKNLPDFASNLENDFDSGDNSDDKAQIPSSSTSYRCLRLAYENLKQIFLSVFNLKLSVAQQEFSKSHGQVFPPSCLTKFGKSTP